MVEQIGDGAMSGPREPRPRPVGLGDPFPAIDMFMDFATKLVFAGGMAVLLLMAAITGCSEEPKAVPAQHGYDEEPNAVPAQRGYEAGFAGRLAGQTDRKEGGPPRRGP